MAYKEEHLDKNGAQALAKALADANDAVVKSAQARTGKGKKTSAKKQTGKKK